MPQFSFGPKRTQYVFALVPALLYFTLWHRETATPVSAPLPDPVVMGCDGSLGENLFEGGDFGSGSANIPPDDPGIAPGYSYARQGPPSDGLYVITNNTGAWSGLYGTWIRIRDNSSDPNGYMMVVNASYEPGIFYQQEITGLCANTTFEFSADVINLISRTTTGHIKPNISFYINDELKFSSGDIPQDETWKTYGFTFTTGLASENLTLSIRNNAPGGIGNDLALDNISFRPCGPEAIILPEEETFVCVDDDSLFLESKVLSSSFPENYIQWQVSTDEGATFNDIPGAMGTTHTISNFASGRYYYRYLVAGTPENLQNFKCRVFSYPKLVTVLPKFFTITDTICSGLIYDTGRSTYTETGIYTDTLLSSFGCDSIVTLDLTVLDDPMIDAELIAQPPSCYGDQDASIAIDLLQTGYPPYSFSLNDSLVSGSPGFANLSAGNYRVMITDKFGCTFAEEVNIDAPRELVLNVGPDTMVALGTVYTFTPFSSYRNVSYQWTGPLDLSCTDCRQPNLLANGNGTFTLQVTNDAGCTAVDSLYFSISTEDSYQIYAPNAFSPNGDGVNDRFTVFSNGFEVEVIELFQVFDRWGNLLYTQSDLQPGDLTQGWDGRYRNQPVDMGVYIYRVDVRFIDATKKTFTGSITAIK
ncbi:gliding motility-associated C-terminal domain-containing protein [Flavilitoribacter nigricans]|uniref:T9SS type B sorting domain-containing protein n=1 Tax=Flavilitoribacter nigricans (strain ATCC 23147 / DSM 23189 / NBRC 102662 / NCIMB 1420 / SS-2) TaxID=1122177 RepID=A0A2D0NBE1_FLAN2|nr:gliding motility-associated C-terminal domain-containing protein [Flavilitoribacter nigricans]PHN05805.1 hypothetical protein CRP01_15135 [Flavilitoribacter nigricans DSM 23189 = NBRC 102662]